MTKEKIERVLSEHTEAYDAIYYHSHFLETEENETIPVNLSGREMRTILDCLEKNIGKLRDAYASFEEITDVLEC